MQRASERFTDRHGIEIFVRSWLPERDPAGVVQISHGVGEHSGRYEHLAEALVAAGFAVYADDHRGHGETGKTQWSGDLSRLGRLGPGGLRATEAAIAQLAETLRDRHPGLSLGLFAHSWGSLMAQRQLEDWHGEWDAIVLSGSAMRLPWLMESGPLNRRWAKEPNANGFEWLSRRAEIGETFLDDPFNFAANIPKLFGLRDAARLLGVPRATTHNDVPLLLVGGSDDPLARGDSLARLAAAYRRLGVKDVTLREYPGARHELLNEIDPLAGEVIDTVITWFIERLLDAS